MVSLATLRSFAADEHAASSALALMLATCCFMIGGTALDVAWAYKTRGELRVAADAAAHAALYARQTTDASTAKTRALDVAYGTLPKQSYGNVLQPQDILFGEWDFDTQTFRFDPSSTSGVLVSTKRFEQTGNPLKTLMMNFVGRKTLDVRGDSVFVTHYPTCLSQGFAAEDVVTVQDDNIYYSGFCLHSNDHVAVDDGNEFKTGSIVSMPDRGDVVEGSDNDGLEIALEAQRYRLRVLDRMDEIWFNLQGGGPDVPNYVDAWVPINLTAETISGTNDTGTVVTGDAANLLRGRVYMIDCSDGEIFVEANVVLQEVVLLTDCRVEFLAGTAMEDAIVMSRSLHGQAVEGPDGFRMGRNDACASGGDAQILTYGGVEFENDLRVFSGQVIAQGMIEFDDNALSQGLSFISGDRVEGGSNGTFMACNAPSTEGFQLPYFRLAG